MTRMVITCPSCGGKGYTAREEADPLHRYGNLQLCIRCCGAGKAVADITIAEPPKPAAGQNA